MAKQIMRISQILSEYRERHKFPLRKLAKAIGIEYNVLWRFEKGKEIESKHLVKILWWLFDDDSKRV